MIDWERVVDEAEVVGMAAEWGEPVREHVGLQIRREFWEAWGERWPGWHREVMFLLPRPGGLLLHRKAHYPPDGWRLPTGGIEPNERVREAIMREPVEEVGLALPVRRYVALLTYQMECEHEIFRCATHIFLLPFSDEPLQPSHDGEIEATKTAPLNTLAAVADQLERLDSPWHDWGRFRAIAHRVVQAHVQPDELDRRS
ncbi:MAG: NUDIX domain-containing protein [Chloroflexota bacterium]|nr:NUDIX domain-containing protein [Chloroflexota bacterium]